MSARQRERILSGMPPKTARTRFIQIWGEANPGQDFIKTHGRVWPWMETWHRLRSANKTVEAMATAFAENLGRKNKEINRLSAIIHAQREELARLSRQLGITPESQVAPLPEGSE